MDRHSIPRTASLLQSWHGDGPADGFSVTLELAFRCNVRCVFCSRWTDPTDLGLDAIRQIARDMADLGAGYVSLTGGDPFVRKDIREIIDAFADSAVPIHINTNGVLLRKQADFLRSRAGAILGITVSIDSPEPSVHDEIRGVEGTFRRALEGMEKIRDVIPVDLACTLNHKNLHEIEAYARFAREQGYGFRFQPLHDDGENRLSPNQEGVEVETDDLLGLTARLEATLDPGDGFPKRQYYRLFEPFFRHRDGMNRLRCTAAARLIYFIDPEGNVYPCDTRRDVPLGNVYRTRFARIVRGPESTGWRETCRKRENGCWCMYACVAPDNVKYQDLPLLSITRGGSPVRNRWKRREEQLGGPAALKLPAARPAMPARDMPSPWPFVSMVMASYNGGEFLLQSVGAALGMDYPAAASELVLVDDAGTDGSIGTVRRRFADAISAGQIRIVTNKRNLGVPGAYNQGVLASDPRARYVLKLDNDLIPEPSALTELVIHAEANPRAGILGGRILYHADRRRIQFLGGNLRSPRHGPALLQTPAELLHGGGDIDPAYLDVINSCMTLVRREVFERAGMWPEFYGRYEYEDYEFAFRARAVGYGSLYCPRAEGYHAVSLTSSANDLGRLRVRQRARNGVLFMSRFAPRSWSLAFLLYHLAKIPLDLIRRGPNSSVLLSGYLEGIRVARRRDLPIRYLPAGIPRDGSPATTDADMAAQPGQQPSHRLPPTAS